MRAVANSLPKSGTHLLTRLLDLIGMTEGPLHLSGSLVRLTSRNPIRMLQIARRRTRRSYSDGLNVDLDEPKNVLRGRWLRQKLARTPVNAYFQAHLPHSDDLEAFLAENNLKLLFIIRDPRDVLLSFVNHMLRDPSFPFHRQFHSMSSTEARLRATLEGCIGDRGIPLASLPNRLARVMGWYRSKQTLTVRFEDLIGPQGAGLAQRQRQTVRRVCDHMQFDFSEQRLDEIASSVFNTRASTFHKGQIGTWKEAFTPTIERMFADACGPYIRQLGYDY